MASHEANKDLDEWSNSTVVVVPLPEVQSMSLCLNSTERQSNVNFTPYPIDANGEGNSLTARSCPRDWDGFLCWPQTLPEQIVLQRCPTLRRPDAIGVTVSQVDKVAEFAWRHCGANGTWTSLQSSDSYSWHLYTNFSACNMDPTVALSPNEQELYRLIRVHLPAIKQMSIVGYSTSLALLLGAFTLLASLKRLRCARNKIHLHLFASFIVRAVVLVHKHSSTRHSDLNFIFFINITRVVFIKMSNSHEPEARRVKYRKWFKSTLVLVPLFGAHHIILMVMSIAAVTPLYELYWLYIDQLFTSFQGSVVALLYCFCNGEVQSEVYRLLPEGLKRKILTMRRAHNRTPLTHERNLTSRNGHAQDEKFIVRHRALNPDDSGLTKDKNEIPLEIRIMGEGAVEVEARL
ncbi:parathyroid hormone/parathyroid hormone-related peptide receptor-like isoform X5 [Varroa jacobsoni]|uniref:parathyroid hormone/parathyroid hormone-related peptide receptor-like isoform X5 n=1 Tax=Varroa jacobsoni TaxID=62625 RepID=UPI000BF404A9|nr:parathyroid hormone/parathyroid hormone-related peptide receptor-like isoform X5 [Varroa jacobsoni]